VLFRFPQTDLTGGKLRPALLLASAPSGHADWLVCMISSNTARAIPGFDEVISPGDDDFAASGLKFPSVILAARLAFVSETVFLGPVGAISSVRLARLKRNLAHWIETS
jgi:mRNA interferase MazF